MTEFVYQRKLASIQTIEDISVHNNADRLELIKVLGWSVVEQKGRFQVGDKVIYLEIDSICPSTPWSAFLEKYKYRVRTIRLRGELSQGLILPLSVLGDRAEQAQVGEDVTELLGVTKYESPNEKKVNCQKGIKLSNFPTHLGFSKTDEPRIQSHPEYLELFHGLPYYATLKYDGTSSTYLIDPKTNQLIVCSRNNRIDPIVTWWMLITNIFRWIRRLILCKCKKQAPWAVDQDLYWNMAKKYQLLDKLGKYPHLVLQGEIYGPNILGNKLNMSEPKLAIFSIFDMKLKRYCLLNEIRQYCREMNLEMVEVIDEGESFNYTLSELLLKAKGIYPKTQNPREGLVFRLRDQNLISAHRASFKVINNDFLEKDKSDSSVVVDE